MYAGLVPAVWVRLMLAAPTDLDDLDGYINKLDAGAMQFHIKR
jgi:hypothetical protein